VAGTVAGDCEAVALVGWLLRDCEVDDVVELIVKANFVGCVVEGREFAGGFC